MSAGETSSPERPPPAGESAPRRPIGKWLRATMSVLLLAVLFYKIPIRQVASSLSAFPVWGVLLAIVVELLQVVVGAQRWRRMLARTGVDMPLGPLVRDVLVSSAYNLILPSAVGGDFIRALRAGGRLKEPHHAWSTTFFERVVGLPCLALVAAPGILVLPGGNTLLWPTIAIALLSLLLVIFADAPLGWLARLLSARAPRAAEMSEGIARDLRGPLGAVSARAECFGWSLLYQLMGISILGACALPLDRPALLLAIYAGVPLIAIGAMLPVSIAGIGLRESLFVVVLGRLGVEEPMALALGFLWLGSYVVLALPGAVLAMGTEQPKSSGTYSPREVGKGPLLMRARIAPLFAALAVMSSFSLPAGTAMAQNEPAGQAKAGPTPPVLQKFVEADYPPEAEKERLEGMVVLQLDIDAEGKVTGATVLNPAGHGFDEAAVEAAKKFEFAPALRNGQPVASRIAYRYSFTLKPVEEKPEEGAQTGEGQPPAAKHTLLKGVVNIGGSSEPLAGARVQVTGEGAAPIEQTTGADGGWALNDLPPGKYQVTVESPGYEPLVVEEEVSAGEATEVVYRLSAKTDGFEVVVKGERPPREVTKRTIEQREINRIPGTNGDALRAIQNMPGVARSPGGSGLLIVRGSAPQDTQVFFNGTLVPIVYHFGGLTSVVPTDMIEKLDFYPGNFSSQFGRVTGGIVDVGIRSANQDGKYHGIAQADFLDARLMAEGPVPFLKDVTFIVGARRSYVDVWLKPVLESAGSGVTTAPVYYDYQAFLETRPTSNSRVRVGIYGSSDQLELLIKNPSSEDPTLGGDIGFRTAFWRLQAEYRHELTDRLRMNAVLAYGLDSLDFNLGSIYFKLDSRPLSNRLEFSYKLAKGVNINVGQDILWTHYDIDLRVPQPPRPGEPDPGPFASKPPLVLKQSGSDYRPAAYAEAELVPSERIRIVPGVRVDYARDIDRWDVSPRVNGRYVVHNTFPKTTLKGGVGVFHQQPQPQESAAVFGSPGLSSARAIHYALGTEQELTKNIEFSVEGFYKQLDHLVSRSPTATGYEYNNQGIGYVVGSEFLLRYKPDARFFGWIAYTLSRSTRKESPSEPQRMFQYDQTHILTALGSYRLGRGWEFGARFRLVSGSLATACLGGTFNSAAGSYSCISGPAYAERLPMFHQLDLRLDKRWNFQDWKLSTYLDLLNVYNHGNVESLDYNYNYTKALYQTGLPIIPSVGLRGEF